MADGPPPTPKWVVTFTDMMSLLLTFFILLLTYSTPKVEKLFSLRGSLGGTFGIIEDRPDDRNSITDPSPLRLGRDQKNPYAPSTRPQFRPLEEHDPNVEILRLKNRSGESIEVEKIKEGYRIRIEGAVNFDLGEEYMKSESYMKLAKVAKAIEYMPYYIVIASHVGSDETNKKNIRRIIVKRAVNVASRLIKKYDVEPSIIGIAAYYTEPYTAPGKEPYSKTGWIEFIMCDKTKMN